MSLFLIAAIACLVLFFICLVRYFSMKQVRPEGPAKAPASPPDPDFEGFVSRLSRMIQIPTVSWTDRAKRDTAQFKRFQEELRTMYPGVHDVMDLEVLGPFGMIYHWKGKNSGKGENPHKKPVLFLAHYDVVPAQEKGEETWVQPPFSGRVLDGVLWGRGTLDIKCQVAFQLETAETLIRSGWAPDRDIYFAFGGDEEISGREGAGNMAALLRERNMDFEFILDEGGVIARDQLAFLKGRPAALVGLAEKGFVTFKISAAAESGHSSMPIPGGTAISRVSRGIVRMEKRPFPCRLDPVLARMLEGFVPHVSFGLGLVFANLWLFKPLILYIFSKNRATDSLIRTTQAPTVFNAGEQENILPGEAACLVNHRILPGETIKGIKQRHRHTLKDPGLALSQAGHWIANEAVAADGTGGQGFGLVKEVLASTHPHVIPVPFLVNGSTDSKHYRELTGEILRFCPLVLNPEDVATIHGVNEKVSLENLKKGLEFYISLFSRL